MSAASNVNVAPKHVGLQSRPFGANLLKPTRLVARSKPLPWASRTVTSTVYRGPAVPPPAHATSTARTVARVFVHRDPTHNCTVLALRSVRVRLSSSTATPDRHPTFVQFRAPPQPESATTNSIATAVDARRFKLVGSRVARFRRSSAKNGYVKNAFDRVDALIVV